MHRLTKGWFVSLAIVSTLAAGQPLHAQEPALPPAPSSTDKAGLSSSALRQAVANKERGAPAQTASGRGDRLRVEVLHTLSSAAIGERVESVGGTVEGEVRGHLVQALIPFDRLEELERSDGVTFIRPPTRVDAPVQATPAGGVPAEDHGSVVGEEIAKIRADLWHAAGVRGAGVKVGIVDEFSTDVWNAAQAAGEVPSPSGTFCRVAGSTCDVFTVGGSGLQHGTAVAETVHEMAPATQLYLATAQTTADLQAVVDYFATNGVKILSRSLASFYDSAGDGTGPLDAVVDDAVSKGITWFNSAGNSSGDASNPGAYYRATFSNNGSNFHQFAPGDNVLGVTCGVFSLGLRWNDFDEANANVTDFDLYAVNGSNQLIALSEDAQGSGGGSAPPLENFPGGGIPCGDQPVGSTVFIYVRLHNAGSGANDILEFQINGQPIEYWSNPFATAHAPNDSRNAGQVTVGAIDPPTGTQIGYYSSQGPTTDNRIKPDVSAAACVQSFTYSPDCFNGTSAATPAAAGAAALVLQANPTFTPAQLGNYLRTNTVDRGAAGSDPIYGAGELILPNPPSALPAAPTLISPSGNVANPVTYRWNAVSGATGYELWVNRGSTQVVDKRDITSSACSGGTCQVTPTVTLTDGAHRFWVRAKNASGNGPYSAPKDFNVITLPAQVTTISPSGTTSDSTPTYTWNAVAGATDYQLWVNRGSTTVINTMHTSSSAGCGTTCSVTPSTVLANAGHTWWVRAKNAAGFGPWSAARTFTVASAPAQVTTVSPSGTTSDSTPTYTWNAVSGATEYQLWVNQGSTTVINTMHTSSSAGCGSTCSVTPSTLLANTGHTWWVRARNAVGFGPWSAARTFTVASAPAQVTTTSPSGTTADTTPSYSWNGASGATSYQLWVNRGSTTVINTNHTAASAGCGGGTGTCTITPSTVLSSGGHTFWVRAQNATGFGPWSAARTFTVS